ncbi:serine protease, partial [Psychrobacter sp. SIMBA_152]
QLDSKDNPSTWQLDLPQLFDKNNVSFLQLIAYVYYEPSPNLPTVELNDVSLTLNNGDIHYNFTTNERHVKAAIILEIYQRN